MSHQIDGLFRLMCEAGASDLHLMVGTPPLVRKDGGMKPLDPAAPVLDGEMIVRLLDRREFKAKVIGTDPNTDVAVVKIDAKGLPPMALGNSDDARVGEWVLAIGNPLGEGLTFTVTSGIVSAKGRALQGLPGRGQGSIQDFIQTDAAINPGNSGGPLVSVRGEVIGINSAIASETGFYSGYGFAIPINTAIAIANNISYGLTAGIVTTDLRKAIRFAEQSEVGMVKVNQGTVGASIQAPFGGFKNSGFGRENGQHAIDEYLQTKSVWINTALEVPNPFTMR